MSLSACQTKIFDKYNIDPADRKTLESAVQGVLESYGYTIENAQVHPDGRKLLKAAVDEALVEAKKDQGGILNAIKSQHPDLFGKEAKNKAVDIVGGARDLSARINEKVTADKEKVYSKKSERQVKLKHYYLENQTEDVVALAEAVQGLRDRAVAIGADVSDGAMAKLNEVIADALEWRGLIFDETKGAAYVQRTFHGKQIQVEVTKKTVDTARKELQKAVVELADAIEAVPPEQARAKLRESNVEQTRLQEKRRAKEAKAEEKQVATADQVAEAETEANLAEMQQEATTEVFDEAAAGTAEAEAGKLAEKKPVVEEEETAPEPKPKAEPKVRTKKETRAERVKRIAAERAAAETTTPAPKAEEAAAKEMTPAEKLAAENDVEIEDVKGTGPNGLVTFADVAKHINKLNERDAKRRTANIPAPSTKTTPAAVEAGPVRRVAATAVSEASNSKARDAQAAARVEAEKRERNRNKTDAEKLAENNGIDIDKIKGTGATGQVTVGDVVNYMNTQKAEKAAAEKAAAEAAAAEEKKAATEKAEQAKKVAAERAAKKAETAKKKKDLGPWGSEAAKTYAESFSTPVTAEEIGKGTGKDGKIVKADVELAIDKRRWREESEAFTKAMGGDKAKAAEAIADVKAAVKQGLRDLLGDQKAEDIWMYRELTSNGLAMEFEAARGRRVTAADVFDILNESLHPEDPYRHLLDKFKELGLDDMPVMAVTDALIRKQLDNGKSAAGLYIQKDNTLTPGKAPSRLIMLHEGMLGDEMLMHVIFHEFVHAATRPAMRINNKFAQQIEQIRREAIAELGKLRNVSDKTKKSYGFTDADEFLAEALTNHEFQKLLSTLPSSNPATTLWGQFIKALSDFFGYPWKISNKSILAEVVSVAPQLFTEKMVGDVLMQESTPYIDTKEGQQLFDRMEQEGTLATPGRVHRITENSRIAGTMKAMQLPGATTVAQATHNAFMGQGVDLKETMRKIGRAALGFLTMDQIVRTYSKFFDKGGKNPLRAYYDAMRKKVTIARDEQLAAEQINRGWRSFEKKHPKLAQVLSNLMHDTTMAEIHPDRPYTDPTNAHLPQQGAPGYADAKARYDAMVTDWNQLGQDGQNLYTTVRDFYQHQRSAIRRAALIRAAETNKIAGVLGQPLYNLIIGATDPATIEAIDFSPYGNDADEIKANLKNIVSLTSVKGPYFPLRRFGNYVIEGIKNRTRISGPFDKRADGWAEARKARSKDITNKITTVKDPATGKYYVERAERTVEMFESISEAQQRAEEMINTGWKHKDGGSVTITLKQDWHLPRGTGAHALLAQAKKGMVDAQGNQTAAAKALDRAFIELLVEHSVRKSELSRKKVQGATRDMRRAFAERAYAGSWMMADFMTATQQHESMRAIDTMARESGADSLRRGEVAAELLLRDEKSLEERKISDLEQGISRLGFFWYLASPSYTAINLTQVPLVALPYLSSKHGLGRATAALWDGYRAITGAAAKEAMRLRGGLSGEAPDHVLAEIRKELSPAEQKMLDVLTKNGIVDATFAQELVLTSKGKDTGVIDYAMNAARTMPQIAELVNRVVVAKAAFNLAKGQGMSDVDATEAASEAVLQTQFDYSDLNKPRYFKAFPGARAIMMFKMYAQGMYVLTVGNLIRSLNPDNTPEQRKQARRTLAGIVATHTLTAGVLGGVFMEPVRALIGLAALAFGDDDEPWNLDNEVTQWLAELTDAQIAELLARGLPRALGIDVAGRVGLNHMAFMGGPEARSYEEAYKNTLVAAAGPIGAIGSNAARGLDYLSRNEYRRGLESLTPKFVRDLIRASRMGDEGLVDYNGNKIVGAEKFGPGEALAQMLGFQPRITARSYEARTAQTQTETALRDRRKKLMQMWRDAEDQPGFFRDEIQSFNRTNPDFRINRGDLIKSRNEQRRRERETKAGAYTDKPSIRRIGEAYGV